MSEIKKNRFTELKAKVKAEMLRRNGTGSVASYGGTDYDFTDTSSKALKEHYEKNVTPLRAVTTEGVPTAGGDRAINESEIAQMEAKVSYLSAIGATASTSGCAASCTGLCQSGCSTTCTGCSGGCSNSCSGCGGACSNGCTGCDGCSGCGGKCSNNCSGDCDNICTGCTGCSGCSGTCSGSCHSCSGSGCTTSCWSACQSTCTHSGAY